VCFNLAFLYLVQSQIEREEKKKHEHTSPQNCQVRRERLECRSGFSTISMVELPVAAPLEARRRRLVPQEEGEGEMS
jgi:hypothetical protein